LPLSVRSFRLCEPCGQRGRAPFTYQKKLERRLLPGEGPVDQWYSIGARPHQRMLPWAARVAQANAGKTGSDAIGEGTEVETVACPAVRAAPPWRAAGV
jgi:hypothetical protein